jgi:signal transduction histidine kinase
MLTRLRSVLAAPTFPDDDEKSRQARVLNTLLLSGMLVVAFRGLAAIPFVFRAKLYNTIAIVVILAIMGLAYWLMHMGRVRLASALFTFSIWPIVTLFVLFGGGVRSALVVFYAAGVVIGGVLLGTRTARILVALTVLITLGMVVLELNGALPPQIFPVGPLAAWVDLVLALFLIMAAINLDLNSLDEVLRLTQQRLNKLRRAEQNDALQVERLRALRGIEDAVLSSADLSVILKLLVREVAKQLRVDAVDVLFFSPETETLDFAAGEGFRTQALRYTRLGIGTGLAGRAAQERQTVHIADLTTFSENPVLSKAISGEGFVTYYGVPLIAKGQLHGVLELFHRQALAPDPGWVTFLQNLAAQAAISIDNARLLEATQQSLAETHALYRISQSLAASLDPDQLMKDVVELLCKDFGFYHVQIYELDPKANALVASHGSGVIGAQLKEQGYCLPLGMGIVGHTAELGQPFTANHVEDVIFFVRNPLLPDTQSEMTIPIKIEGQVLGVLDIQQSLPGSLTLRQMNLMEAVADQLAVALQKANLYTNLQTSLRQEKAMRAQLIQSDRLALVGRLLASVSHELNNPIQAIQNALFLIKEEEKLSEQGRADLEIVLSETERMSALINRLRATYRATHSEDYKHIQLNDVVEDVRTLTATHMRRQDIRFEFQPDPELPPVAGIPDQMRQVILNLFMNAIEAMPSGGCLTVHTARLMQENRVSLSFSDTGTGIDPQILPHIFEPFVSNKESGTGLGLTITYDILQQHHGELRASNNPEGGATFELLLPMSTKA